MCEALFDARGDAARSSTATRRAAQFFDEFQERLRSGGLPHTRVLTGD